MLRWDSINDVPRDFGPSVLTIGNFDGVHSGHEEILRHVANRAHAVAAQAVAVTFQPHPSAIHHPSAPVEQIMGLGDKLEFIARTGIDGVLVQPYSWEFAQTPPEQFVMGYLVHPFATKRIVVGRDVRFGLNNSGTLETLLDLGKRNGFTVDAIDDIGRVDPVKRRWSSTWARQAIDAGDIANATTILGHLHRLRATVVHGDERGRTIGFPTANLGKIEGLVPADGIYAGWLSVCDPVSGAMGQKLPAAISIGTNPTFHGTEQRVEVYVLDRDDLQLYDAHVIVEFVQRIRGTLLFDSVDTLVTAMRDDVSRTRMALGIAK